MIREAINDALKAATHAEDRRKMCTLRLVHAAIKDRDIAARDHGKDRVSDAEILQILDKMVHQREDSLKSYEEAGRLELAQQEAEEIEIIRGFLPKPLSDDELQGACQSVVDDLGAHGLRDMGKTMAALKSRYAGQIDCTRASSVVRQLLR